MEEILKELINMNQFNSRKEENLSNQQAIKEEKKELEELHEKLELTLLGSNDRVKMQKEYDDKKLEIENKEKEMSENSKKNIEKFDEQRAKTIETIDLELGKYKKKEEIDALISQKNAYAKMVENSKRGIEKIIAAINEGKDTEYLFNLKMERESLQANSKKVEELENEINSYKVIEDSEKTFSDLSYLKTRIQGMNFDNMRNLNEDPFLKEYGKEQLEMEEAFQKQLEEAQKVKEDREEKIKGMSNEEFAKWYTDDENKKISIKERFNPEKIKSMSREEFKEYYTKNKEEKEETPTKITSGNAVKQVDVTKKIDRKMAIKFNAKRGYFIIQDEEDLKTGKKQKVYVSDISAEDKEKLKQYISKQYSLDNKAMKKIDMNVAAILCVYDKNKESDKLKKYVEILSKENKEPIKSKLRDNGITINYDMRGLYRNKKIEKQDKRELMKFANESKANGVGEVKKDIRTIIYERIDNLFQKVENKKIKKLDISKEDKQDVKKKVEQEDKVRFSYKVSEEEMKKENDEMQKTTDEIIKGVKEVMQKSEEQKGEDR